MPDLRLRNVVGSDLPLLNDAYATKESTGDLQWFGFFTPVWTVEEMGRVEPSGGRLMVERDAVAVATVVWTRKEWGPLDTCWCWEAGVLVFSDFRRNGVGRASMALLCDYLFDSSHAHRIQAVTDRANSQAQRMLEATGFEKEGVIRDAQWRCGRWHDQILYSRIRGQQVNHGANGDHTE